MLKREELVAILGKYKLSHIQSEQEVRSKLIVDLIEWLGYPSQYRAEDFKVFCYKNETVQNAKKADFLLFDDTNFDCNNGPSVEQLAWVQDHSLLVVEGKKPGKMPENTFQPRYYSICTSAVGYLFIDGSKVRGYLWGKISSDLPLIDCDLSELVDNNDFLQFSFENIKRIKEEGIENIKALLPIQYKKKLSTMCGESLPDINGTGLITRYIIRIDDAVLDHENNQIPLPFDCLRHEKRIILLADAGQGKTFSLYQIYNESIQNGYHPFFYSLRSLTQENVLSLIAQEKVEVDENAAFILDGLDEMSDENRSFFLQIIGQIIVIYPEILFIVSSRSNTFSEQFNTFDAQLYTIKDITQQDIHDLLCQYSIDEELWFQQVAEQNLDQFCKNAFYLNEMFSLFSFDRALAESLNPHGRNHRIQDNNRHYTFTG